MQIAETSSIFKLLLLKTYQKVLYSATAANGKRKSTKMFQQSYAKFGLFLASFRLSKASISQKNFLKKNGVCYLFVGKNRSRNIDTETKSNNVVIRSL